LLVPRRFGDLFGMTINDPAVESVFRSVGVREVVIGIGLWSAASHGGRYQPWLLARALIDGGDTLAVAAAVAAGSRAPRFLALGGVALGAALTDSALYWLARRQGS
jgi:hypothetical protein